MFSCCIGWFLCCLLGLFLCSAAVHSAKVSCTPEMITKADGWVTIGASFASSEKVMDRF
jgi:hypothetical protein